MRSFWDRFSYNAAFVEEAAERKRLADTGSDQIFNIFTDNEE